MARDGRYSWALVGGSGFLESVPEGVDDGVVGGQLVHVDLHDEHFGSVVLDDVQGGGECRRSQLIASSRQTPQSRLSR